MNETIFVKLKEELIQRFQHAPKVYIRTFGCQQNVADSERIKGMLMMSGCVESDSLEDADIIVFNTCAVRGHAENRTLGHLGTIKTIKQQNKQLLVAVGGCMVHQEQVAKSVFQSYPYVDIIFNTNELNRLPETFLTCLENKKRVFRPTPEEYSVNDELPTVRDNKIHRAFIPIMYGCNNFCSYCIVPYVRGRERSRPYEDIEKEFKQCVDEGFKDIMLLGQNVNSYGKGLSEDINFPELLRRLNQIPGDFVIRFMSSHPKDATHELFDTIASCSKVSKHIHLAVQSGSDTILEQMNRHYTKEQYLDLLGYAREHCPGIYFTSDIIVGFPGESEQDYLQTVDLIKRAKFYSIFSFIYSKREGTKAALLDDHTPHKLKADRLNALNDLQKDVSDELERALIGTTQKALCINQIDSHSVEFRLDNNSEVTVTGNAPINEWAMIKITDFINRRLYGEVLENV